MTVVDDTDPVITCPGNITVGNDAGNCDAVVNPGVTATDNCSATVSTDAPAGNVFPVGTTTVTATATDASNNTASCSFTVTVNDVEAPTWNPLACGYSPGQNPGGSINPNYRSGFHTVMAVEATDNCGAVYYEADIDGVPVEIGDMVHVTIAPGQTAGKITSVENEGTQDEVTFIVGPNGLLSARVKDGSGNYLLDPNALAPPADQRLYCREVARKPY